MNQYEMQDILHTLQCEIDIQKSKIQDSFTAEKRFAIIELTRCIDHSYIYRSMVPTDKSVQEIASFLSAGFAGALRLFLDESINNSGYPLFPSHEDSIKWANDCLLRLGHIGFLERMIILAKQGLLSLKQNEDEISFKNIVRSPEKERLEAEDFYWWQSLVSVSSGEEQTLKELHPKVKNLLIEQVDVWQTHFIKYGCTEELDKFYELLSERSAKSFAGYDYFHKDAVFKGISFSEIKKVVTALVGYTLKHKDHCQSLLKKTNYSINPWNIYTLPDTKDELAKAISIHKEIELFKVAQVLEWLTLDHGTLVATTQSAGCAPPPLIKIGSKHVLRSLAGILSNPFIFLITNLKETCNKDYFTAVNKRESLFKRELYDLFSSNHIYTCENSIDVKVDGKRLTDIDAMLYDKRNETVVLVQLKWQDVFSTSMIKRNSMLKNFVSSANKWVEDVYCWTQNTEPKDLLGRIPKADDSCKIRRIYIWVLGRNFSKFSGTDLDRKGIWCSWYTLQRILNNKPTLQSNLHKLMQTLKHRKDFVEIKEESSVKLQLGKRFISVSI